MINQESVNQRMKATMKRMLTVFIIVLAVAVIGSFVYIYVRSPKVSELSESKVFAAEVVYAESAEVIALYEQEDYTGLREGYCSKEMAGKMTDEALKASRDGLGDNWGERVEITGKEGYEAKQGETCYAMTQYNITYDNISLTYTLMFDTDMKLAGFSVEPQENK